MKKNTSKLVLKQITDKNGKKTSVWVEPAKSKTPKRRKKRATKATGTKTTATAKRKVRKRRVVKTEAQKVKMPNEANINLPKFRGIPFPKKVEREQMSAARSTFGRKLSFKTATDSELKEIIKNPKFKKWFGNSVVTKNGKPDTNYPITLYHGTMKGGFKEFDMGMASNGLFGKGLYFTNDKEVAESYMTKSLLGTYHQAFALNLDDNRQKVNKIALQHEKKNRQKLIEIIKILKDSKTSERDRKYWSRVRTAVKARIRGLMGVPNMTNSKLTNYIDGSKYMNQSLPSHDVDFYNQVYTELGEYGLTPKTYEVFLRANKVLDIDADKIPTKEREELWNKFIKPELPALKRMAYSSWSISLRARSEEAKKALWEKVMSSRKEKKTYGDFFRYTLAVINEGGGGLFGGGQPFENDAYNKMLEYVRDKNGYEAFKHRGGVYNKLGDQKEHDVYIIFDNKNIKATTAKEFDSSSANIFKGLYIDLSK